jgi:hypothetical protein
MNTAIRKSDVDIHYNSTSANIAIYNVSQKSLIAEDNIIISQLDIAGLSKGIPNQPGFYNRITSKHVTT